MSTYNSYHTEIKCLARENLLANEIIALIPRSNIWHWRKEPSDKYKSFNLNLKASQDYELIKTFSQSRKAKRVFFAYVRLSKFFVDMVQTIPTFQKHIRVGVWIIWWVRKDFKFLQRYYRIIGGNVQLCTKVSTKSAWRSTEPQA